MRFEAVDFCGRHPPSAVTRLLHSRRLLVALLLALGLVPLALLAYVSTHMASNAISDRVRENLASTATMSALYVNEELRGLAEVDQSFANRVVRTDTLDAALTPARERETITEPLTELSQVRQGIGTAFLADPSGRLVEIVPAT